MKEIQLLGTVENYSILLLDAAGNIQSSNKGSETILGYCAHELAGSNVSIFYTTEDINHRLPELLLNEARKNGRARHSGWRLRKDGTTFWADVVVTVLHDENQHSIGFSKITSDATELHDKMEFDMNNIQALIDNTNDIIWSIDTDCRLITSNHRFDTVFEQINNRRISKGDIALPESPDHPSYKLWSNFYQRALAGETFRDIIHITEPEEKWAEVSFYPIKSNNTIMGAACYSHDVTNLKQTEQHSITVNRLYSFISQMNQAIVRANDEQTVFDEACRIAVDIGKFKIAWISRIDKPTKTVELVAECGMERSDIDRFRKMHYLPNGALQQIITTADYFVCNDFEGNVCHQEWKEWGKQRGIRSFMILPIIISGEIVGGFHLCCTKKDFFNEQEIELLQGATNDVSFAINYYRDKTQRELAEEKLKHNEKRLMQAQEIAHLGSWEFDFATGKSTWSAEHCRIFGVQPTENVHELDSYLSFIFPDDREHVRRMCSEGLDSANSFYYYHRIIRRSDGAVRYIYCENHFEFNANGVPLFLYGVSHDITETKLAEQALINVNRLYSFTSHINQTIVRAANEWELFTDVCRIATEIGKFPLAWIAAVDEVNKTLNLVAESGADAVDIAILSSTAYDEAGFTYQVLQKNSYHAINDLRIAPIAEKWKEYTASKGFKSGISFPIRKSGQILFTFNLLSDKPGFFSSQEIALLEEAAMDISFAVDVLEKERIKQEAVIRLRHNEKRLKQAQQIAQFGSWELDFATGIATCSEESLRIYGLPPEDYLQTYSSWLSFVHPDDLEYVIEHNEQVKTTTGSRSLYHRILRKDGSVRFIHSFANVQHDSEGKPVGLYGVTHDVTDMKLADEAIRQSKRNLRQIIDMVPQAVFAKNYDGKFVFVNKSFAALYGLAPEQLTGKYVKEVIPNANETAFFVDLDREVIDSDETRTIPELVFTDRKGRNRIFHTVKVPFVAAGTNEKAVLGIAQDITEQKRTETEKAKILADIIQRNQDLEQFSYIVSHNLRAPVANIMGLTGLLQLAEHDEEDSQAMMNSLVVSTTKLDTVIKDLNFVLQVKNHMSEKKELISFSELVGDIEFSIENTLHSAGARIEADFSEAGNIFTIKSYLYSIFFNLISNAVKYRRQEVPPVINIRSEKLHDQIKLIFSDNGMGMDLARYSSHVFGLYKRFHEHAEGKGMGLYMVKTQVESLGGKITVDSEINKGTRFTIIFNNGEQT